MKQEVQTSVKKSQALKGGLVLSIKKADETLQGRLIACGCSQKDGEQYDSPSIHAPITYDTPIYNMLTLMLMADWET